MAISKSESIRSNYEERPVLSNQLFRLVEAQCKLDDLRVRFSDGKTISVTERTRALDYGQYVITGAIWGVYQATISLNNPILIQDMTVLLRQLTEVRAGRATFIPLPPNLNRIDVEGMLTSFILDEVTY